MKEDYKKYFNTHRPFYAVYGTGEGGVSLLIKKNLRTYLYRLLRFQEFNRYVVDGRGLPVVYNKLEMLAAILDGKHKVHAKYTSFSYEGEEWWPEKYNEAWFEGMYSSKTTTLKELNKDPYHFWVYGYKAHFFLEGVREKRKYYAYHKRVK